MDVLSLYIYHSHTHSHTILYVSVCLSVSFYNGWVALVGTLLCVAAMFLISWWNAIIAIIIGVIIFVYVAKRSPPVSWGPSGETLHR